MFCCMIGFHMNLISKKICNTQLSIVRKGVFRNKMFRIIRSIKINQRDKRLYYTYNLQLRIHISLDGITEQNQQTFLPISHENLSHGQLTRALLSTNQIPCVFVLRQSDHERPNRKDVL